MSLDQITRRYGWGAMRALHAMSAAGSTATPDSTATSAASATQPSNDSTTTPVSTSGDPTRPTDGLRSTFATLFNAVRSGDMVTARSALAELPSEATTYTSASARQDGRVSARAQAGADLQSLLTAVANGDQAGAQSAMSSLQSDFTAMSARHRHERHHHHWRGDDTAASSTATSPATGTIQSPTVVDPPTPTINAPAAQAYASAGLPSGTTDPTGQQLSASA